MDTELLCGLIAEGKIKETVQELIALSRKYILHCNTEILLVSSRFASVNRDKLRGTISATDFNREVNSITYTLLELIKEIDATRTQNFRLKNLDDEFNETKRLNSEFEKSAEIKSHQSRLRMKNDIVQKIAERFLRVPELMTLVKENPSNGFVCGLCRKIQIAPDFGDLDILEPVTEKVTGDFTRGNIVLALAQIIYHNKLGFGDDKRIEKILSAMQEGADKPLEKNIESVRAALEYFVDGA